MGWYYNIIWYYSYWPYNIKLDVMDIEELMDRYMDEELTSFNKTELRNIKKELNRSIKSCNSMLKLPLTEDEFHIFRSDSNGLNRQIEEINIRLEELK